MLANEKEAVVEVRVCVNQVATSRQGTAAVTTQQPVDCCLLAGSQLVGHGVCIRLDLG